MGAIPVINENDTVATTEIRYGDNDRLAARVAQWRRRLPGTPVGCGRALHGAAEIRSRTPRSSRFQVPRASTAEVEKMAKVPPARSSRASGMKTKIEAGKIADRRRRRDG